MPNRDYTRDNLILEGLDLTEALAMAVYILEVLGDLNLVLEVNQCTDVDKWWAAMHEEVQILE